MINNSYSFNIIENYMYLYHIDQFVVLPVYPESISDQMSATFNQSTPLARSAPIYSYSHSGPRTLTLSLTLHRDLMSQVNYDVSNLAINAGEDYVDTIIRSVQAMALPAYVSAQKLVDPPMIAVRFGNDIYCKGVVNGAVSIDYQAPILENNKYAIAVLNFSITEIDPYDAEIVYNVGSFRGLDKTLERKLYGTGAALI